MNRLMIVICLVVLLPAFSYGQGGSGSVKGELLVKFRTGVSEKASREMASKNGGVVLERFAELGWQRIKLPAGKSLDSAMADYLESPQVETVQPNYYYRLLATPNDASFGSLWGMTKISAPQAWDLNTGSPTVVVANIDTGVKYDHEDLAANMWTNAGEISNNGLDDDNNGFIDDYYGYDFYANDADPMDETTGFGGHGTHTAGTIGAVGNNTVGVVGVNWNVRIMAIKIYSPAGTDSTSAMLINAYNYVRIMKNRGINIRVTNNSYGGCNEACGYDQALKDAIDALGSAGVLNVFAAGNSGTSNEITPFYPASYTSPSILAVAASNQNDDNVFNFGLFSVDLTAPGIGILSTYRTGYQSLGGTSMATPHVAGAAALLSAYNPSLSAASLKATLMNSVDQRPQLNGVVKTGGRLNVASALQNQTVCSFNMPTSSITVPTKGGHFTVDVTAGTNCDYQAKSNAGWIRVVGSDSFSGNGTVTFRATVNPTISRSATVSIAGSAITVNQSRN